MLSPLLHPFISMYLPALLTNTNSKTMNHLLSLKIKRNSPRFTT